MHRAASRAAEAAAPIVYDAIRNMSFADAVALVRGGPTAATDFLTGRWAMPSSMPCYPVSAMR